MSDAVLTAPTVKVSRRIPSLDGLRGLAAIAVVIGHARLVLLQNHDSALYELPVVRELSLLVGVLGAHAVWLFFVLSGFVLTWMMLGSKRFDYGDYLLSRLARLYIPVAGGVAFTILTMLIVSRDRAGFGQWVDNHPDSYTLSSIIYDLTLIGGPSGNVSPLWSLQWEVLFSLLLILYTAVIRKVPPMLAVVIAIALCVVGRDSDNPVIMFMSMFAIGTALAFAWDRLAGLRDSFEAKVGRYQWLYAVGAFVALALTVAAQLLPVLLAPLGVSSRLVAVVDMGASMLGLTACIVLVGLVKPLRVVFETRFMQWLGLISFSIYLVHEPILLAFTYAFDAAPLAILAAVVVSFPIAQLFYWAIEKPSHGLARRLNKKPAGQTVSVDLALDDRLR